MNKKYGLIGTLVLLLGIFSLAAHAASVPVVIEQVWIDDDLVEGTEVRADLQRGESFEVKVKLRALEDADDLRLEAQMSGDERHDIDARSEAFDVEAGKVYFPELTLSLPNNLDLDPSSEYIVEVEVTGRGKSGVEATHDGKSWYVSVVGGKIERHDSWTECEKRIGGVSGARFKKVKSEFEERDFLK